MEQEDQTLHQMTFEDFPLDDLTANDDADVCFPNAGLDALENDAQIEESIDDNDRDVLVFARDDDDSEHDSLLRSSSSISHQLRLLDQYTQSKLLSSHSLLLLRLSVFAFSFIFVPIRISQLGGIRDYSMFFTNAGWIGMCLYEGLATIGSGIRLYPRQSGLYFSRLKFICFSFIPNIPSLLWFFYPPFLVFSFVISLTYWTLLREDFSDPKFNRFSIAATCIEHIFPLLVSVTELNLVSVHIQYLQILPIFFTSFLYLIWVWIYHYGLGWDWPYFFMEDWFDISKTPFATILVILVAGLAEVLLFFGLRYCRIALSD